jgi:hypothetical protein
MKDVSTSKDGYTIRLRDYTVKVFARYSGKRSRWTLSFLINENWAKGHDLSLTPKQKEAIDIFMDILESKL